MADNLKHLREIGQVILDSDYPSKTDTLRALSDLYRGWDKVPGWHQVDVIAVCAGLIAMQVEAR